MHNTVEDMHKTFQELSNFTNALISTSEVERIIDRVNTIGLKTPELTEMRKNLKEYHKLIDENYKLHKKHDKGLISDDIFQKESDRLYVEMGNMSSKFSDEKIKKLKDSLKAAREKFRSNAKKFAIAGIIITAVVGLIVLVYKKLKKKAKEESEDSTNESYIYNSSELLYEDIDIRLTELELYTELHTID